MKKNMFVGAWLFVILVLCSACNNDLVASQIEAYEQQIADLESEIEALKGDLQEKSVEIVVKPDDVDVVFTNKENIPEDIYNGIYSDYVRFKISVTNNLDKPIRGVQGTVEIQDLFGETILIANCDFTGQTINPNESVVYSDRQYEIDEFIDSHTKLYTENFEDLRFIYTVNMIVYADGSSKNAS